MLHNIMGIIYNSNNFAIFLLKNLDIFSYAYLVILPHYSFENIFASLEISFGFYFSLKL